MGGIGVPMGEHSTKPWLVGIFFMLWIFIGCFVAVNMTIGIVVDTFSQIKDENDGLHKANQRLKGHLGTVRQSLQASLSPDALSEL